MNSIEPNQKTKFCIYCGKKIPINAKKCKYCFEWLDDESPLEMATDIYNSIDEIGDNTDQNSYLENRNYARNIKVTPSYNNPEEYSKAIPIRRFYLLFILTFGLYSIYWFYKQSSYLRDEFGKDGSVGLRTLAFAIIPIANIFVFYELLKDMKQLIEEKGLNTYSPGINTLIFLFVPYLGMWVFINVQESFNEFWKTHEPELPVRRDFNNGEILVMLLTMVGIPTIIFFSVLLMVFLNSPTYYY